MFLTFEHMNVALNVHKRWPLTETRKKVFIEEIKPGRIEVWTHLPTPKGRASHCAGVFASRTAAYFCALEESAAIQ